MCNEEKYINIQTGEVLDWERVSVLKPNAMLKHSPHLFNEWDFEKNDKLGLDVYKVTTSNGKIANWRCTIDVRHRWRARVADRKTQNCPYCSNHRLLVGYNSMWDTNFKLASLLADPEDGHKYMQSSSAKVNWKCPDCENIIRNKQIAHINTKGLSCPRCSDGKSYPEKFMYNLLQDLGLEFEWEKTFDWSNEKRYDFYLEYKNTKVIIECHGKQHYEDSPRGRSLLLEQENDRNKYEMAVSNGINKYIVIDCRESSAKFIKDSIIKSNLLDIFDKIYEIDWSKVALLSESSLVLKVNEMWNSGNKSVKDIAKKTKLHVWTIGSYLKTGKDNGWNDYCPKKAKLNGSKSRMVEVVLINKDYQTKMYNSAREASLCTNIDSSSIIAVCKGKRKSAGGYRWMYLETYKEQYGKLS